MQIWNDQHPSLLFQIASFQTNVTQDTADDGSTNGRRAVRKSLSVRAVPWGEAVDKGKRLLEMLQCGTGTPSPFISHDDLEKWGWKVDFDDPASPYQGNRKTAVDYLGASYSPGETWTVGVFHHKQVTVDGTVYPITDGSYANDYAPEFIISTDNESPRTAGPKKIPPVEGPFPKLERQSDLMFLEYQRKTKTTGICGSRSDSGSDSTDSAICAVSYHSLCIATGAVRSAR